MTAGTVWRPRLPVSAIRGIPEGRAMLLYHTSAPALVRVRLAHCTRFWRQTAQPTAPRAKGPLTVTWTIVRRPAIAISRSLRSLTPRWHRG
jgi:hypothetical protein